MISITLDNDSSKNLYAQIYESLREEISEGRIEEGDRLPSLRSLSEMLDVSITTVRQAYDQLDVEGYLERRPGAGFYVVRGAGRTAAEGRSKRSGTSERRQGGRKANNNRTAGFDPKSFDFVKWKKCMSSVLNDSPELLLTEGDRQGEPELRAEIADYLYRSRGVICTKDQVVISAGTQQLVSHLARILRMMGIELVSTEDPGYLPVRSIFRDWGFSLNCIPVLSDGIDIDRLPVNIRSAVYVSPQNQFPTGAVMPISRRRQLLEWAGNNDSIVIEDDYDSELRYSGMPVPALCGLDKGSRVVYIGSFTSTLFPAVRISYMVLPESMLDLYHSIMPNYDQTCSKTEQLTLALFMKRGYYQTNLRKIRKLYSAKLKKTLEALSECDKAGSFVTAENMQSGLNLILRINTGVRTLTEGMGGEGRTKELSHELAEEMIKEADALGLKLREIDQFGREGQIYLNFYYTQIPEGLIKSEVTDLIAALKRCVMKGSTTVPSVYEVIRIKNGRPVLLKEHYERLVRSLGSLRLNVPFTYEELADEIDSMIIENGISNHNLRLDADINGHSVIYMSPTHYPPAELYETGVRAGLFRAERRNPNIKMMDRELRDATDREIKSRGLYEVLLVDRNGCITEGSRSNVFFIKGREVYTSPVSLVLPGVTRGKVMEIIREMGLVLREEEIPEKKLHEFDAAFISGTSPEVLPIAMVEKVAFDKDNEILREIMQRFSELTVK